MNSQHGEDLHLKIDFSSAKFPHTTKSALYLEKFFTWFHSLSRTNKLAVVGAAVLLGFVILQTVFKFMAFLSSLALWAVLVYLGYKFFTSKIAGVRGRTSKKGLINKL
jgi:hypothetical protein